MDHRLLAITACLLLLAACSSQSGGVQLGCSATNLCLGGRTCVNGTCVDPEAAGVCLPLPDNSQLPSNLPIVAITDRTVTTPAECSATLEAGADIDAVGLYRYMATAPCNAKNEAGHCLVAVGRVGSAQISGQTVCGLNSHDDPHAVEGPRDASGTGGWLTLNGRTVEFELAGCKDKAPGTVGIGQCDGLGDAVVPQTGDELDVYEVDSWYTDRSRLPRTCKCVSDDYQVDLRPARGVSTGGICAGLYRGTTSHIELP